jgi:hypothetical protein
MKRGFLFLLCLTSLFILWGCYPQGPDYAEEMDVVLTYHNDTYDFVSKATYAMPSRIVKITGSVIEGEEPDFIPDAAAQKILAMIEENMDALGWERVDTVTEDPDMLLLPASWETEYIVMYNDYWYWYWGGYYPYWGYPPYYYYSSYSTGTLLMSLIDPDEVSTNGNPVVQWSGAINGILTGTYDATRINTAIDKAFNQSPYLKTN